MFRAFNVFGIFNLYLISVFLLLAAFWGSFVFWKHLHQRTSYKEFEIFDGFLLSLLAGLVIGRLSFIIFNWTNFGWHPWHWLNFISYPGLIVFISIFISSLFLWLWLRQHKIDNLEILDYWARATTLGLVFYNLGLFFDGSGSGFITTNFLGVKFPDLAVKLYPAQLYSAVFFSGLFFYLAYLEKNYRTYIWYRGNRSQARTGFLFFVFLIAYGLYSLFALTFEPNYFYLGNFALDWILYLLLALFGSWLLFINSAYARKKRR